MDQDGSVVLAGYGGEDIYEFTVVKLGADGSFLWQFQVRAAINIFPLFSQRHPTTVLEALGCVCSRCKSGVLYCPNRGCLVVGPTSTSPGCSWCRTRRCLRAIDLVRKCVRAVWCVQARFFIERRCTCWETNATPPSLNTGLWPMPDDQDGGTDGTNQLHGVAVAEDGSVVAVGYTYGDWGATNLGDIVHSLSLTMFGNFAASSLMHDRVMNQRT